MRMSGNLLNGITPRERCVTNDAANPRATLTDGLTSTSGGSASVPGGLVILRPAVHLVSRVTNREVAWAANMQMEPGAGVPRAERPRLSANVSQTTRKRRSVCK
jgi:hypothetical protein